MNMKTFQFLEIKLAGAGLLLSCAVWISSCQQKTDTEKTAEKINREKFETRAEEKDAQLLVDLAVINMEEIQLGKLAQSKSTVKEVKDLGKMMEEEHMKSLNELKAIAGKKGVTIPTDPTAQMQEKFEKMGKKQESEFNEEFCDMMVKDHKDAIDKVEKAATESQDNDIKAWASETLPGLKKHLDHAMSCQGDRKMEGSLSK